MSKKDKKSGKRDVVPVYETYTVTDNVTDPKNERVYNRSIENVILSKKETDENEK